MSVARVEPEIIISYLKSDEQCDSLYAVVAAVDVVAHEQIVGVRRAPADAEQLHQIVELAVDVPADCHRAFHLLHVGLFSQDLLCL